MSNNTSVNQSVANSDKNISMEDLFENNSKLIER
jgi:hypothetical protein